MPVSLGSLSIPRCRNMPRYHFNSFTTHRGSLWSMLQSYWADLGYSSWEIVHNLSWTIFEHSPNISHGEFWISLCTTRSSSFLKKVYFNYFSLHCFGSLVFLWLQNSAACWDYFSKTMLNESNTVLFETMYNGQNVNALTTIHVHIYNLIWSGLFAQYLNILDII